jgi:hypothetical protein
MNKRNFENIIERTNTLLKKNYLIDKMHILNHKSKWRLKHCNPFLIKDLNEVNTVSCEQTNF